jgi:hypothetical protein
MHGPIHIKFRCGVHLSSEVLKGYFLFMVYKTNIFIKLLKLLNANVIIFVVVVVVYFCGIWPFFPPSQKHLLIILLRLEFVVLVL